MGLMSDSFASLSFRQWIFLWLFQFYRYSLEEIDHRKVNEKFSHNYDDHDLTEGQGTLQLKKNSKILFIRCQSTKKRHR